ncbi:hypothetical protein [Alkalicoccus saliphilus]|jgi:hypothetical protein|nr:hypothetical protein [Alkalicoccus saliphilus]
MKNVFHTKQEYVSFMEEKRSGVFYIYPTIDFKRADYIVEKCGG